MGKMGSRRPLLLRFNWARGPIAATLASWLTSVLLLAGAVHALDPNKRITQYVHTAWRYSDHTAPDPMYAIGQTSDGFLWFVSADLYRFDGVRFLQRGVPGGGMSFEDPTNVFGQILNVYGDHAGGLWVLGVHGIVRLKDGIVTSHFDFEGIGNWKVIEYSDGSVWVTRGSPKVSDSPLCHITERGIRCFGKADGIPIAPLNSILPDGKGGFWLGGQTTLVHWHSGVSETYPIQALKSNVGQTGIAGMARGPDGSFWLGIFAAGPGRGLGRFTNGIFQPFVTPGFDGSKLAVSSIVFDRDENLWVSTQGNGIYRIHGNVVEHYGRADGLSSDAAVRLYLDREGILWAATTNGIDSFRDPHVASFTSFEGVGNDVPMGVLASRDGTIWVANRGSLDHISKERVSFIRMENGLPGNQVTSMLEDRAGNLWVGVDDGLYWFKDGHFRRLPEPNHKPLGLVIGLAEDVDGNVWAECLSKPPKLVRIRDFQVQEEFSSPQVPDGYTLAPDPHGGIWIGTLKGDLALFRHGVVQQFPLGAKRDPISHQIIANADGSVLASSADGLVGVRDGKVQRMTMRNGLRCNVVTSFIQDKEKRWWLFTDCGISELADSELHRWWANPEAVLQTRVYDQFDGVSSGRPRFNSAALSQDGRVWFASGVFLEMVDPSRVLQQAPPAETYIESVVVDRKEFAATDNLKLSPHPRDLQIDYTSPTFTIPQKVRFRYRLDNYDRDWHDVGTRRQAFYTDLPPGKYCFRVVASNSAGVWDDTPARLDFSVTPAYYQTNWFRALCAVFFMALLWAGYQWRVRQLRHQFEMTLDARVGERTRIARELHDTLLQSFHGVLLRFQTAFQLLPERPVEAKEKLGSAIELAAEAITEGRDAVQGLRDSTTQTNDLALAVSTLGEELAADSTGHRPAFRVAVEGQSRDLHPILRDEVYKIAAEALRNAFVHANAKQVEVEIRYDDERFRLRVRDDGRGIDAAVLSQQGKEGHFGLPGMQERAKLIGGKLTIWSEVDAGSEVELRLPADVAYASARRGSWFSRNFAAKAKA